MKRRRDGGLLIWLLGVAAVTLFPFEFRPPDGNLYDALRTAWLDRGWSDGDVALNVLLFAPLGIMLNRTWRDRLSGWQLIAAVSAAGLAASVLVEGAQRLLPRRDPSVIDVASNTIGALVGACLYSAWRPLARQCSYRVRDGRGLALGVMAAYAVLVLAASEALQRETRLSNWSDEYPLLVGNEATSDRAWSGRLFSLELTDAATPATSLRRLATSGSSRLHGRQIAAYDFDGGPPYRDGAGNLPDLGWVGEPPPARTSGVVVNHRSWLRSEGAAAGLARRLRDTNAFTLRVRCATDDVHQGGPARIVSNSLNTGWRNFMLGQLGKDLVVRLRTPLTGLNGSRPEIVVPGVFSDTGPREIVMSYDGATLWAAASGASGVHRTELTPGSSLALKVTSLPVRADELKMLDVMYLGGLFVVPGALLRLLGQTPRARAAAGIACVFAFALMLEATLTLSSGRPFGWERVGVGAMVGTVVVGTIAART